jgi:hypothetical protein
VPGGWLYSVVHYNGNDARQSVTFVPYAPEDRKS